INDTVEQTYHFQNVTFKGIVNFKNIHIKDLNFKNVIFNNIVVFDNTTLDSKPKFINCTFSNQFNIEHDYIQYNHEELEEEIEKNHYDEFLNLRDLFRKLKSNRITHHNLIDASELRAQELYARELELKHKENKNLKDAIEQWQLFFYRKLCDHHTDLVLNAKWLVFTIALYILLIGKIWYIYPIALISFFIIDVFFKTKNTSIIISSIIIFITLYNQPKMILAIPNLLSNDFNWWQNLITSIYIIVFGLIIFSLQKTARKNTIIPN
ncbi:pentapeptide repeat-containing protein, partial [Campylobacter lari]|nr:pentapeptide repeat-containing protein [Campylobacter lari]